MRGRGGGCSALQKPCKSAPDFGTVGLSRGATGELDVFGRAVIVGVMFIGRVGPLTLGFFLATRIPPRIRYPAGRVYLGRGFLRRPDPR